MRREIGSEFWDIPITNQQNSLFPESTQWFLSGRSALHAIVKELKGIQNVAVPSWCCESMIKPFIDSGVEVHFYPIYCENGRLTIDIDLSCDVLFLIDYFGYTGGMPDLISYKGAVIRDVTHSIFSTSYADADYYFGSLRKWCGVWTGGYAWTDDGHMLQMEQGDDQGYTVFRKEAMLQKASYIKGYTKDKRYLGLYKEAETVLENAVNMPAADRDIALAKTLDVDFIRRQRRSNAEVLRQAFPERLIFQKLADADCPMFVPIILPEDRRDALRRELIQNEIYCPIHWPLSKYHKLGKRAKAIYENELSLVCDQRYSEEDMYRIVGTIKSVMEDE